MKNLTKKYIGTRGNTGCDVKVLTSQGIKPLSLHLDVLEYSLTGFEWGYYGRGPHQLSVAILVDSTNKVIARKYCREFTKDVISQLPRHKDWELSSEDVLSWVHSKTHRENHKETITE